MFIADRLAEFVDPVFADPAAFDAAAHRWAVVAWAAQIYCDFSGYSDMAVGCAKWFGFELPRNFNLPYLAAQHHRVLAALAHRRCRPGCATTSTSRLGGSRKGRVRTLRQPAGRR